MVRFPVRFTLGRAKSHIIIYSIDRIRHTLQEAVSTRNHDGMVRGRVCRCEGSPRQLMKSIPKETIITVL